MPINPNEPNKPEKQPKHEDAERIDLSGGPNPGAAKELAERLKQQHQQSADASQFGASLQERLKPGMNNADVLAAIIDAPIESLIPWETCVLPSDGRYYDGWEDGSIRVRAMNQVAEKILATDRLAKSGESIDYLFRECCQLQGNMDPVDLLLGDRVFILYFLRGITFGPTYEFAVTCPNTECGASSTHAYNINDLSRTVVRANAELGTEPFKVILPHMSRQVGRDFWISMRLLRARDSHNMLAIRRQKRKFVTPPSVRAGSQRQRQPNQQLQQKRQVTFNETISENLEMCIVSAMGDQDRFKIKKLVERLHSEDTAYIREWLRDNSPGMETIITLSCPDCGTDYQAELPITESFFRPTERRGSQ